LKAKLEFNIGGRPTRAQYQYTLQDANLEELPAAGHGEVKNLCVWVKDNAGMGSLYRSQHELVLVFKHGRREHRNNVQFGRFGRNRSDVSAAYDAGCARVSSLWRPKKAVFGRKWDQTDYFCGRVMDDGAGWAVISGHPTTLFANSSNCGNCCP
jgi:hypothetical protein